MTVKGPNSKLTLVSDEIYRLDRKPETSAERIKRLQDEAKLLAREEIEGLMKSMLDLSKKAEDISRGGEAYPAGLRELASRVAEENYAKIETFQALLGRIPLPNED